LEGVYPVALPVQDLLWHSPTTTVEQLVKLQLRKLSQRKQPARGVSPLRALIEQQLGNALRTRHYRHWIAKRSA